MKSTISFCILFWLCLALDSQSSQAQVVLKGIVKDAKTGETLIGANVVVKGTTIGAQTDFDGKFSFNYNGTLPTTLT
ncbi:MAG: carboxypeptidase-like regulatory domain-containing protein, partial [Bacteroidota bacterium]